MSSIARTKAITAQNEFTETLNVEGNMNLSIYGTWSGTVTVQRSFDGGVTWLDVNAYTTNIETSGFESESQVLYRVGIKTGDFTSGVCNVRLGQ